MARLHVSRMSWRRIRRLGARRVRCSVSYMQVLRPSHIHVAEWCLLCNTGWLVVVIDWLPTVYALHLWLICRVSQTLLPGFSMTPTYISRRLKNSRLNKDRDCVDILEYFWYLRWEESKVKFHIPPPCILYAIPNHIDIVAINKLNRYSFQKMAQNEFCKAL